MAHLPGASQVDPGHASIHQGHPVASVGAWIASQPVKPLQARLRNGIELSDDPAVAGNGHRKRSEIVEHSSRQFCCPEIDGICEPVVVAVTRLRVP